MGPRELSLLDPAWTTTPPGPFIAGQGPLRGGPGALSPRPAARFGPDSAAGPKASGEFQIAGVQVVVTLVSSQVEPLKQKKRITHWRLFVLGWHERMRAFCPGSHWHSVTI